MARAIQTDFWEDLEALNSADREIVLIEIAFPTFTVRFARDVVDYIWEGQTYFGAMFSLEFLTDNDKEPKGTLRVPNVNRVMGESVLALSEPPSLRIVVLRGSAFLAEETGSFALGGGFGAIGEFAIGEDDVLDDSTQTVSVAPKETIVMTGDDTPIIDARYLLIKNIRCTAQVLEGDIIAWDMSAEPFPGHRATKARFPGLYA